LTYYIYLASKVNFFRTVFLGLLVAIPVSLFFWQEIFNNLNNLLNTDIAVVQGEKEVTQAFHGRGGRWSEHWTYFTNGGVPNLLLGLVGIQHIELIGHGSHNDYLRLTYASGFIGALSWLIFNISIAVKISLSRIFPSIRFGIVAIILFWMLQAVSLTPSSYHAFNFVYGPLIVLALKWKN
jgi:O-antigen ligase